MARTQRSLFRTRNVVIAATVALAAIPLVQFGIGALENLAYDRNHERAMAAQADHEAMLQHAEEAGDVELLLAMALESRREEIEARTRLAEQAWCEQQGALRAAAIMPQAERKAPAGSRAEIPAKQDQSARSTALQARCEEDVGDADRPPAISVEDIFEGLRKTKLDFAERSIRAATRPVAQSDEVDARLADIRDTIPDDDIRELYRVALTALNQAYATEEAEPLERRLKEIIANARPETSERFMPKPAVDMVLNVWWGDDDVKDTFGSPQLVGSTREEIRSMLFRARKVGVRWWQPVVVGYLEGDHGCQDARVRVMDQLLYVVNVETHLIERSTAIQPPRPRTPGKLPWDFGCYTTYSPTPDTSSEFVIRE